MTFYCVDATIRTKIGKWKSSIQIPTFYLNSEIQGITSVDHAERVAKSILDPYGLFSVRIIAISLGEDDPPSQHESPDTWELPIWWPPGYPNPGVDKIREIYDHLRKNKKIMAIKAYKDCWPKGVVGLAEAKAAVEAAASAYLPDLYDSRGMWRNHWELGQ